MRLAGREVAQAFGQMTADISGNKSLFNAQAAHTIVTEALEADTSSDSLDRRIWRSFVPLTGDAMTKKDLEKAFTADRIRDVQELFALLDLDQNGDVSSEEMISTVIRIDQERIAIWKSTHDIQSAVRVLDHFFQVFILIGTVQEFLGSFIFIIFVKHPFDVGDRVIIDGHELAVEKISLLCFVFQKVPEDDTENLGRRIRDEIGAPENRRDFRGDVDVELVSIGGTSKLEVYVEAEHKAKVALLWAIRPDQLIGSL
ncbi:serine threonine protein kinase [Colletotrichum chrysophilum]|uniref:Serine threonine protein kinase n=1 Tax=Colletotrichum chrysophilum TaxID=1836956 RepID=A0AAD9EHX2_9PEZI|nr:serine threonine protein kinase [Colletotrichum chrysophilum]